jgi:hypothetical protein
MHEFALARTCKASLLGSYVYGQLVPTRTHQGNVPWFARIANGYAYLKGLLERVWKI